MRVTIYPDELADMLGCKKSKAYQTIVVVRDVFPTSAKLIRGRCYVSDLASYLDIPEEKIQAFLKDRPAHL